MANTWTTTWSLNSVFKRSGADLVTTMASFRLKERMLSSTAICCTSAVILIHQPPLKSGIVLLLRLGSLTLIYRHWLFLVFNIMLNQRSLACLTLWESKHLLALQATGSIFRGTTFNVAIFAYLWRARRQVYFFERRVEPCLKAVIDVHFNEQSFIFGS